MHFQGLFKDDEAFGPGIWTESNGGQNIGFWKGTSLVRLAYPVGEVKQLATNSYNKIRVLRYRRVVSAKEVVHQDFLFNYNFFYHFFMNFIFIFPNNPLQEIRDYGVETLEKVNASPNLMLLSDRLHGIYCKIPQSHLFMKKQFDDVYMDDLIPSEVLLALIRSASITVSFLQSLNVACKLSILWEWRYSVRTFPPASLQLMKSDSSSLLKMH